MAVSKENTKRGSKFLSQKNFLKIFLPYFIFLNFYFTQNSLPDKILNSPSSLPILFAQLFSPLSPFFNLFHSLFPVTLYPLKDFPFL